MYSSKKQVEDTGNNVKSCDVNVMINRQRKLPTVSNMCSNDVHSLDFQIHTNIEVTSSKKMKIYFFISSLISFMCIAASFFVIFKMNAELIEIQTHIGMLNRRLLTISIKCDNNVKDPVTNEVIKVPNVSNDFIELKESTEEFKTENNETESNDFENMFEVVQKKISRLRRANQRNKPAQRKVKSSGALAAHFKGSLPEILIEDQGLIGPWYPDNTVSRQYKFPKFHLTEGKCSIEVTEPALYFIYAQVYYITSNAINSYSVYVRSEGSSQNNVIARCSVSGPNNSHVSEISCYTAAVYNLKANDRIFIKQTERNRTVILRDGYSFFGIVRLNNTKRNRF